MVLFEESLIMMVKQMDDQELDNKIKGLKAKVELSKEWLEMARQNNVRIKKEEKEQLAPTSIKEKKNFTQYIFKFLIKIPKVIISNILSFRFLPLIKIGKGRNRKDFSIPSLSVCEAYKTRVVLDAKKHRLR
jgi:hypothetical protein